MEHVEFFILGFDGKFGNTKKLKIVVSNSLRAVSSKLCYPRVKANLQIELWGSSIRCMEFLSHFMNLSGSYIYINPRSSSTVKVNC